MGQDITFARPDGEQAMGYIAANADRAWARALAFWARHLGG